MIPFRPNTRWSDSDAYRLFVSNALLPFPSTLTRPPFPPPVIVIKDSILQKAVKSFVGTVYATKWRVNGTIMVIFIFRSGILRHQARPLFEDLGIYANGRTKTDRSNSPLVVVTFSPP